MMCCEVEVVGGETTQPSQPGAPPAQPAQPTPWFLEKYYGIPVWLLIAGGVLTVAGLSLYFEEKRREEMLLLMSLGGGRR